MVCKAGKRDARYESKGDIKCTTVDVGFASRADI